MSTDGLTDGRTEGRTDGRTQSYDTKQYSEFQDPISSNSLHIVLTRFFYCNNNKV